MASDSRPQGERRDLRLTSPRRRGRRPAFAATPDNRETLAKSGETKRSEGETKGFVWPATRRSNATAAKPAISPSRAFSMDWPRFCFASAKTPPAERAMAPVRGRTAGGGRRAETDMAGSRTAKGHSTRILIFRKQLFAPVTIALPCRPRANGRPGRPTRRCSADAGPSRSARSTRRTVRRRGAPETARRSARSAASAAGGDGEY